MHNVDTFDCSPYTVLVVGDVMLDRYFWGDVRRISPESPVPVLNVTRTTCGLGGAANVARNCASLGCTTVLTGVCGSDEAADMLHAEARQHGIVTELVSDEAHPTTVKTRAIGGSQQLIRFDEEYTRGYTTAVEREVYSRVETWLAQTHAVIISDYYKGVCIGSLCSRIITLCRRHDVPVYVDPKTTNWERYTGATMVTPNAKEFRKKTGCAMDDDEEVRTHAQQLLEAYSLDMLLLTRGAQGMSLYRHMHEPVHIPAQVREVYDVSGAGDTVIATFAAAAAAAYDPVTAARIATTAAGIVVGKLGTQSIARDELLARLSMGEIASASKVCSLQSATTQVSAWKAQGKRVGFTNGCFDLLHVGHIKLLHEAAARADTLIVAINTDASVRRLKGQSRPIIAQQERAIILAALACVDMVVLFDEDTPRELIERLKPDVLIKGGDYTKEQVVGHDQVTRWGGTVVLVDLLQDKSTSSIVDKVNALYGGAR
jgi:D-beta-D-heptose 7-phosphate kinase/D-beta-D-heptose 1-phosphate adenosyltransferase